MNTNEQNTKIPREGQGAYFFSSLLYSWTYLRAQSTGAAQSVLVNQICNSRDKTTITALEEMKGTSRVWGCEQDCTRNNWYLSQVGFEK